MSVKLTDAQLLMMSAAAQREDRCLKTPETMKGAVVGKASAKLVKLGFAREIQAKPRALSRCRAARAKCSSASGIVRSLRPRPPPRGHRRSAKHAVRLG